MCCSAESPKPKNPSKGGGNTPAKGTKQPCPEEKKCWVADYEKEISTPSYGRYSQPYKKDGTPHAYKDKVEYKIYAPVKTGTEITVEIRFKVAKLAKVTDTDVKDAKAKLEKGVQTYWDNKFTVEVDDPECGKKSFKLRYKIVWVNSKQHYTIKIHETYPRDGVTGNVMDVSKDTTDWVYAHEVAHCFGMPDEYSYTADDGTLDAAVSAPTFKDKDAADATIMSSHDNTTVLKRHAWYAAIETQALLTAKLGRKIKCDIK
jgi:type VI secretion system secreted protein VgrG